MPLDPAVRKILEELNKVMPQMTKVSLDEFRKMFRAFFTSQPGRPIYKVYDITIPGTEAKIPARVYIPRKATISEFSFTFTVVVSYLATWKPTTHYAVS